MCTNHINSNPYASCGSCIHWQRLPETEIHGMCTCLLPFWAWHEIDTPNSPWLVNSQEKHAAACDLYSYIDKKKNT